MITEERLKELLEQGATIYEVKYGQINIIYLKDKEVKNFTEKYVHFAPYRDEKFQFHKYYDRLFETKEEAEWQSEFSNITRTETLNLPTWEKFTTENYRCCFFGKNNKLLTLDCFNLKTLEINENETTIFEKPLTKENYIEACRLAKKLFLEESDETYND